MAWYLSSRSFSRSLATLFLATKGCRTKAQAFENGNIDRLKSLDDLIDDIVSEGVTRTQESRSCTIPAFKSKNIQSFCKLCANIERPFTAELAALVLLKLAKLADNEEKGGEKGLLDLFGNYRQLFSDISTALNKDTDPNIAIKSLSALLKLGIDKGDLYESLLTVLKSDSCSQALNVGASELVQLSTALRNSNCADREQLQRLVYSLIELKTSEICKPADLLFVMTNCYVSADWFESLLKRMVDFLPLMTTGNLVSLLQQLAKRHQARNSILPLIAASLTKNSSPLLVTQLGMVAESIAVLKFADARLLRKIADDIVSNRNNFKKWSHLTSIVVPFAKLRFGHRKAWEVLTAWINENYRTASLSDLSRAITACAICNKGNMVKEAAEYLSDNLQVENAPSPTVWLNSVHSLAICGTLKPRLAETVLRPEFLEQFTHEDNLVVKVYNFSKIAQIQAYIQCVYGDKYRGSVMELNKYCNMDKETNNAAAVLKYGARGTYSADLFHNVIYKLVPLDSHAIGPFLSSDGYFVDAVVQVDKNCRFVRIENFNGSNASTLAIIFLSSKQLTVTCDASEENEPLGTVSLGIRLLKKRGMIPVTFTELEINAEKILAQKIELVRNRLLSAAKKF